MYREGEFVLSDNETSLEPGDEVILLPHSRHFGELEDRWQPGIAREAAAARVRRLEGFAPDAGEDA